MNRKKHHHWSVRSGKLTGEQYDRINRLRVIEDKSSSGSEGGWFGRGGGDSGSGGSSNGGSSSGGGSSPGGGSSASSYSSSGSSSSGGGGGVSLAWLLMVIVLFPVYLVKLAIWSIKLGNYSGRLERREFWQHNLLIAGGWIAIEAVLSVLIFRVGEGLGIINLFFLIGTVLASPIMLGRIVRRLHDTGRSAWWLLALAIPVVGWVPVARFCALPGTPGPNAYGPAPKTTLPVATPTPAPNQAPQPATLAVAQTGTPPATPVAVTQSGALDQAQQPQGPNVPSGQQRRCSQCGAAVGADPKIRFCVACGVRL